MKPANSLIASFGTTVFETMSRRAIELGAINLGQGFPDDRGPDPVLKQASEFLYDPPNQYPPMLGVPDLRQAVAAHNKRFYDIDVDWRTETMVSTGATEGLAACFLGLIEPGDEVIAIEPTYDCYQPIVRRAGGVLRIVSVKPPEWTLDLGQLAAAFSEKTKVVIVNSPQNPGSKVYTEAELTAIADLAKRHDAYVVCDEVYEHMTFDGRRHVPMMTLPGMRERTIRIGSAGKTFSLTGWKVGYLTLPEHLLQPVSRAHQFLVFTTAPNLQRAVAFGLSQDDAYFDGLRDDMQRRRDRLLKGLERVPGMRPIPCQGSYFLFADVADLGFESDVACCEHLVEKVGVAALPVSVFYSGDAPAQTIRFCFAKRDEVLDAAVDKLAGHFGR